MRKLDILLFLAGTSSLAATWVYQMSIDLQSVPTIVNGAASSMSIIVAFTGVLITFAVSNRLLKLQRQVRLRLYFTILLLALSLTFLYGTYIYLMLGDYYAGFKMSITGLTISIETFISFISFFVSQLWPSSQSTNQDK